jgi:glucokinase
MHRTVLALDLGGTNFRIAAVNEDGGVIARYRSVTPNSGNANDIIDSILESANNVRHGLDDPSSVLAIAAAVPATIDDLAGILVEVPNLPILNGINLRRELEDRLGLAVVLRNDATSAAVGEHWLGASRNVQNSICITLGTGIGGGIILNGDILLGPDGTAGEIGHICIERDGPPCGCGSRGCLEQYASARAIVKMAIENGINVATSKELFDLAENGDLVAQHIFGMMGTSLGVGLAGLINSLNPEMIVVAGGVSAAYPLFIKKTKEEIEFRAYSQPASRAKIVRAELGDDAGVLGAARSAFDTLT